MLTHYRLSRTFLLIGIALVAGCGTPSRSSMGAKDKAAASRKGSSSEWPAEKITEAHAHYAAGIIHELDEEPQAALQEYSKAALNDPDNESLVLDVSRRFLERKQPEKALEILMR